MSEFDCYDLAMLPQQRHELIVRSLRTEGSSAVRTLAERLGVSPATIRRDLVALQEQGRLTRVYGGAVSATDADEPFAEVATVRVQEKDSIASRCAELIKDGDTILLDIGTTAHRLARALRGRALTVITSNLAVYEELAEDADIQLILLGGVVRRSYRSLVGFLTEDALRQVQADRLFLSTSGVRRDGQVMDTTVVEVTVKRAMIAAANQIVLLADATKFPGTGVGRVCGPEDLDVVVTNAGADPETCQSLRDAGVEVIEA